MATLENITHDSGPPLTDHWTTVTNSSGRMSVTVAAALNGSVEGLNVAFGTSGSARLNEPYSPPGSNELRLRFYFNPNGAATPTVADRTLMRVELNDNGSSTPADTLGRFTIRKQTTGIIRVQYTIGEDGGGGGGAGFTNITDDVHCFELRVVRASSAVANDGIEEFLIDGVSESNNTGLDNFDIFTIIDFIFVEFSPLEAAMSGTTLYADEFLLTDVADAGLCITGFSLASMTKPASINADGTFIYLALLDGGTPILTKIATDLLSDGTTVFNPGAGDNIGVQCGKFDANIVWIAGNFGGTDTVEKSENAGSSFTVKDPATFDPVTSFVVGPDNDDRVLVFTDAGGSVASSSIQETTDSGASWDQKDSGLGFVSKAVERLDINVEEIVTGNEAGASDNIHYSPNTGEDLEDYSTGFPTQDVTKVIVG